ncbi:MAG: hypothetical protein QF502_02715 [Nitrospinaceae bacterium]|nr:hypothetical protein [Nitrospinaceae bacterium]
MERSSVYPTAWGRGKSFIARYRKQQVLVIENTSRPVYTPVNDSIASDREYPDYGVILKDMISHRE